MRKIVMCVVVGVMLCSLILVGACTKQAPAPSPSGIEPVKLRLSSTWASQSSAGTRTQWFMDEVTKRTNGMVTWEPYWASALAPSKGQLDLVEKGAVDIMDATAMYWPTEFPTASLAFCWPIGSATDPIIVAKAARQLYNEFPEIAESYKKRNVKVLCYSTFSYYRLLSRTPINNLEDLKGKKVALIGRFFGGWFEPAGAVPVVMSFGDRYAALQAGLIDASLLTVSTQYTTSQYEVAKYMSNFDVGTFSVEGIMINLDSFNELAPEVQKVLVEVGEEAQLFMAENEKKLKDETVEKLKAEGVTVTEFPAEDIAAWAALIPDVPAEVAAELEEAGMPGWKITKRWQEITTELGYKWPRQWAVQK
ncbi:TRAP transporter substrate-binding protein DctP [Chloroflexota bacterium]